MIVSGLLTITMVRAAVAPKSTMESMFGASIEDPLGEIVVRNWGVLVTLVGLSLVYGGFSGTVQVPILLVAGASKLAFIGLVFIHGRRYLRNSVAYAIAVDSVFVVLFGAIILTRM
jgi:hypothetical protein